MKDIFLFLVSRFRTLNAMQLIIEIFAILLLTETYSYEPTEPIHDYPSPTVTDFADLVSNYKYFVDKTLLIKDFLANNHLVMLTRPRGWGKTINLSMLSRFFEIQLDDEGNALPVNSNRVLFEGGCYVTAENATRCLKPLKIMRDYPKIVEEHQGKYPVIHLNCTELMSRHFYGVTHNIDDKFKRIFHTKFKFLKKYYTEKRELKGCDLEMLERYVERDHIRKDDLGVEYVIQAIAAHFNTTIFVFIDDYDEVFRSSIHQYHYYTYMRRLFRKVYDDIFLTTNNLKGLIVGVTTAPKIELTQTLRWSYMIEDTLVETSYADYYGFTEEEVNWLLSTSDVQTNRKDINFWYKGYFVADRIIYNPNAILGFLNNRGQLASYTIPKYTLNPMDELLFAEFKAQLEVSTTYPNLMKSLEDPRYDFLTEYSQPFYALLMDEWSVLIYSNTFMTVKDANRATYEGIRKRERSAFYGFFLYQGYFTATQRYDSLYNFSIPNYEMRSYIYETFVKIWLKRKINWENTVWIPCDWELRFSTALSAYQMERLEDELNKAVGTVIRDQNEKQCKHIHHSLMTLLVFPLSRHFLVHRYNSVQDKAADFVLIPATTDVSKQNAIVIRYTTKAKCARTMLSRSKLELDKISANSSYQRDIKLNKFVKNIYSIGIAFYKDRASLAYKMDSNPNYVCIKEDEKYGSYPPHNTMDFAEMVLRYEHFVDKTLLIKDFLEHNAIVLVTRPQRWGKTINLDMLRKFFQIEVDDSGNPLPRNSNRILFEGGHYDIGNNRTKYLKRLKIAQLHPELVEKHQGKYPVIFLKIDKLFQLDYNGIARQMSEEVKRIFHTEYAFLKKYYPGNNATLKGCDIDKLKKYIESPITRGSDIGVKYLVHALAAHFDTTVFVFVDEYDYIFHRASLHTKYSTTHEFYVQVRKLFRRFYDDIFKQTSNIRGMLVGVTNAPKIEQAKELQWRYMTVDTLLHTTLAEHFGFTDEEVDTLLSTAPFQTIPKDFKHWYRGYQVADKILYNPVSVIRCLGSGGQLQSYSTHRACLRPFTFMLLTHGYIKHEFTSMMYSNTQIPVEDVDDFTYYDNEKRYRKSFYGAFLEYGYFTAVQVRDNLYNLSIPNYEMRWYIYNYIVRIWMKVKVNMKIDEKINYDWELQFSNALLENRMDDLTEAVNKALCVPRILTHSCEEKDNRKTYHRIMNLLVFPLCEHFVVNRYNTTIEKPVDLVAIPATVDQTKQNAFLIRYQRTKRVESLKMITKSALRKIYNSSYRRDVRMNTCARKIYSIGIGFYKNKALIEYKVDPDPNT